jgi:transposase
MAGILPSISYCDTTYYRTLVAVANKHARILWGVLAKGERFDPSHAPARHSGAAGA